MRITKNRSRFCEGSMNDRRSAVPPVRFLQTDLDSEFDQPVPLSFLTGTTTSTAGSAPALSSAAASSNANEGKKGLLGQVWSGMRDKLGLKRDSVTTTDESKHWSVMSDPLPVLEAASAGAPPSSRTRSKKHASASMAIPATTAPATGLQYRSKQDVLENYNRLVQQGFFKAHAVQSSRMPGPKPGPPPSHPPPPVPHSHALPRRPSSSSLHSKSNSTGAVIGRLNSPPPNWPLPPASAAGAAAPAGGGSAKSPAPKPRAVSMSQVFVSPASSRGMKRMAVDDSESDDDADEDGDKENRPSLDSTRPQHKLRKIASSASGVFHSKTRSDNPTTHRHRHRHASGSVRRSISAHQVSTAASSTNRLSKRPPPALSNKSSNKSLRAQGSTPTKVVPDAQAGVPGVPAIPPKFTYGQDRETGAPWRGLRVR